MKNIVVRMLSKETIKKSFSFVASFIEESRLNKAKRYKKEDDQLLSMGGSYLIKRFLPDKEVIYEEGKKPYILGGPSFNISHSNDYVVFVSDDVDIGIDIEIIDSRKIDAIYFVLKEDEKDENIHNLFRMWTNKESLAKCKGTGVNEIKNASPLPLNGVRTFDHQDYYTVSMIYMDYALSITRNGKEPFDISIVNVSIMEDLEYRL